MRLFVDTSALLAVLDADDRLHRRAWDGWKRWLEGDSLLVTSNYIVLETTALVQHRMGIEAVSVLYGDILPVILVEWVDSDLHDRAILALLSARQRDTGLVDWTSFELMRRLGIRQAFTFDHHFAEMGFETLPS